MKYMIVVQVLLVFGAIVVLADVSHILPNGKFNWILQFMKIAAYSESC